MRERIVTGIEVSDDGRTLTIEFVSPNHGAGTLVARREDDAPDWTPPDIDKAIKYLLHADRTMLAGEKRRIRRYPLPGGYTLWVHVNTGPPTWWAPRVFRTSDGALVTGWLRALIAVKVTHDA